MTHSHSVKQPDLNWHNQEVRQAMYDVLRFWLERGVDGFRVDVIWLLLKNEQFRDNPMNPDWKPGDLPNARQLGWFTEDQPGIHEIVREMRAVVDHYGERVLISEIYLPLVRLMHYYGEQLDEAHLPFNFQLVTLPTWKASTIRQLVDAYEGALPPGAWPNWVLGNHGPLVHTSPLSRRMLPVSFTCASTLTSAASWLSTSQRTTRS